MDTKNVMRHASYVMLYYTSGTVCASINFVNLIFIELSASIR